MYSDLYSNLYFHLWIFYENLETSGFRRDRYPNPEEYSEPLKTSKMEYFMKIVNG